MLIPLPSPEDLLEQGDQTDRGVSGVADLAEQLDQPIQLRLDHCQVAGGRWLAHAVIFGPLGRIGRFRRNSASLPKPSLRGVVASARDMSFNADRYAATRRADGPAAASSIWSASTRHNSMRGAWSSLRRFFPDSMAASMALASRFHEAPFEAVSDN